MKIKDNEITFIENNQIVKYRIVLKIDGNDKTAIKGASFQIKKYGSNTVMKFKKLGNNNYIYDKDGKVLTLKNVNLSEYTIIGLPNGEYFVEETGVPSPYTLPTKEMDGNRYRTTRFKIDKYNLYLFNYDANNGKGAYLKNASTSATITIKNFKTAFKIQKTGVNGAKLKGVVFTLYKEDKQTTIPLWKSQIVLALGVAHSANAVKVQNDVTNMTNELLKKNAETLKMSTIETAKASERGIVDIETLRHTNESLISTLDEVMRIQEEGRNKRKQAEVELHNIEEQLKNKLLALRNK